MDAILVLDSNFGADGMIVITHKPVYSRIPMPLANCILNANGTAQAAISTGVTQSEPGNR